MKKHSIHTVFRPYRLLLPVLAGLALSGSRTASPEPEVFVGTSPCDDLPRKMLSIPLNTDCEMIRWELTLHPRLTDRGPSRFGLRYRYGMTQPGTPDFRNGGSVAEMAGTWEVRKEADRRTVYRLDPTGNGTPLSFRRLDARLLHLLDPENRLMIGNAGWSYSLNRKDGNP
ncbi:hypothetical protein [Larkinella soli]|uniref:hypothetical protein n=1 Tax=Larkinella soli TaxID=1770527 RepID=UPI000FFC4DA9|nr:hypothetical protein [Larkinella soli]